MSKAMTLVGVVVIVLAAIALTYSALTPRAANAPTMGDMGSGDMHMSTAAYYNTSLILLSLAALAGGAVVASVSVLGGKNSPRTIYQIAPTPPPQIPDMIQPHTSADASITATEQVTQNTNELEGQPRNYLILRLLKDDEKIVFKSVMDAGGSALQKDIISTTKMSKAKVTRVLDKLQSKGLVTRERHSSTNMIRIRS